MCYQSKKDKKMTTIESIIKKVAKKINEFGLECDGKYNTSNSDYGLSIYMYAYDKKGNQYKVRISDHSVANVARMANEIHVNISDTWELNLGKTLSRLEKVIFPDRFLIEYTGKVVRGVHVKKYTRI